MFAKPEKNEETGELQIPQDPEGKCQKAIDDFCHFIKSNRELLHLDLSNTDLQLAHLQPILEAISQSQSLMSVHLDGNPALRDPQLQPLVTKYLNAEPQALNQIVPFP